MAEISRLARLVDGVMRNVDVSANTLVVDDIKIGGSASGTTLTKAILDNLAALQDGSDFADGTNAHTHDGRYFTETELGGSGAASGSDLIGDDNTYSNFTPAAATVKGALSGIDAALVSAGGTEFGDDVFRVTGSADATKKVAIEADGITTGTTRTITMPDADVDLGDIATNTAKVSADGSVTSHSDVTDAGSGAIITGAERTKLSGIEALADVTDAVNVAAAGATMNADTDVSSNGWVIDEDDMISDDATKVPTQQSVKSYVDTRVSSATSYKGGYDAATDTPSLDSAPNVGIAIGDQYTVTVAGTFYTIDVEVGDVLIAEVADPTQESDWTIVNRNLDATSIKAQYESNADTNAFTDAEQTKLAGIEANATADQTGAEIKALYEAEADTNAFTDAEQTKLAGIEAGATGDQTGAEIKAAYEAEADTNAFTDAEQSKLAGIEANATADQTGAEIKALYEAEADTNAFTDSEKTNLGTLSDGSNADSLHKHDRIIKTMIAGETFEANTTFMIRMAKSGETAGRVYKADFDATTNDNFYVYGVVEGNGAAEVTAGNNIEVVLLGEVSLGSSDTNFDTAEVGDAVHLQASGAFDAVTQITYADNQASYRIGMVQETDKILVGNMQLLGVN